MASNQETALLALQQARRALEGFLEIPGAVLNDVLTFDGLQWLGAPAAGGGPPGAWRTLAQGSFTLLDNIQTSVVQVGPLLLNEQLQASGPTPLDAATRTVINQSTALAPLNGHTHWAAQSAIGQLGFFNYQARQQDLGGASVAYIFVIYGVIP